MPHITRVALLPPEPNAMGDAADVTVTYALDWDGETEPRYVRVELWAKDAVAEGMLVGRKVHTFRPPGLLGERWHKVAPAGRPTEHSITAEVPLRALAADNGELVARVYVATRAESGVVRVKPY